MAIKAILKLPGVTSYCRLRDEVLPIRTSKSRIWNSGLAGCLIPGYYASGKNMEEKINELNKIRISAIFLHSSLSSPNIGEVIVAQAELDTLIDSFQSLYAEFITGGEIETARKDVESFLKLIDSTAQRCRKRSKEKTS